MRVGKPCEGVFDLVLWIWLFPVMICLYVFIVGKEASK